MLIDLDRLLARVGSKYAAVILAARRARQIVDGAVPLVEPSGTKPVSIALEELIEGKLPYRFPDEGSPTAAQGSQEPAAQQAGEEEAGAGARAEG